MQPSGLLSYLDSDEEAPNDVPAALLMRDNLKLAQVTPTPSIHVRVSLSHSDLKVSRLQEDDSRRRGAQWKQIEQQVELFLLHWKSRISQKIGASLNATNDGHCAVASLMFFQESTRSRSRRSSRSFCASVASASRAKPTGRCSTFSSRAITPNRTSSGT